MSNATIIAPTTETIPTYELAVEPATRSYYLSLTRFGRQVLVDHEEIRECAGPAFGRTLMVVDRLAENEAAGVEIISPVGIELAEERNGSSAIEISLGRDHGGDLVTTHDGLTFDGSDSGQVPGVEVDYTQNGEVIALRVERAEVHQSEPV